MSDYYGFRVDHSTDSAGQYLSEAVEQIDEVFGKGYAKEHPELVGVFMQVAAIDFGTAMVVKAMMYHGEQVKEEVKDAIADVRVTIEKDQ